MGQSFKNMEGGVKKFGTAHQHAFTGITDDHKKAHAAAKLLERSLGFEMPRALSTAASSSAVLGPLLAKAFSAAIILSAAQAVIGFGKEIAHAAQELGGFNEEMQKLNEENIKASRAAQIEFKTAGGGRTKLDTLNAETVSLQKQKEVQEQLNKAAARGLFDGGYGSAASIGALISGKMELNRIDEKLAANTRNQVEGTKKLGDVTEQETSTRLKAEHEIQQIGLQGLSLIEAKRRATIEEAGYEFKSTNDIAALKEKTFQADERAARERIALARENADKLKALQNENTLIGLQGTAAILEKERQSFAEIELLERRSVLNHKEAEAQKLAATERARKEIGQLLKQANDEENKLFMDTNAQVVDGFARIETETQNKINEAQRDFEKNFGSLARGSEERIEAEQTLQNKITDITRQGENQRKNLIRQNREETIKLEEDAAIASLPPWQRATAEILRTYEDQERELRALHERRLIDDQDFAQRELAIEQLKNAQIVDQNREMAKQIGSDLESIYDDITNGSIGKRILSEFKHLFFQILGGWLSTVAGIRNASAAGQANGGGLLGGLLGSLLGLGGANATSTSATIGAAGSGGTFGGGSLGGGIFSLLGLGGGSSSAMPGTGGFQGTGVPFGSGAVGGTISNMPTFGGGIFGPLAQTISSGTGTKGAAAQQGGLLGLLQGGLSKFMSHGITLGHSQMTGTALGVGGALLGISSIIGAYQSGSKLQGTLGGALGGAMFGFSVGGPIGAAVGAIIGGIAGFFSGLFGGKKKKKQANQMADNTLLPALHKIEDDYKGFQIDYGQAMSEIEQFRQDSYNQIGQYGSQGKSVWTKRVLPEIDKVKHEIDDFQKERDRRSSINFGLPQFHQGGYVSVLGERGVMGSEMPAMLKDKEFVVNPTSTARYRPLLEAINEDRGGATFTTLKPKPAGAAAGSVMPIAIHLHTMDAKNLNSWLNDGGAETIATSIQRAYGERGIR